jgi:hypothetical protein
LRYPAGRGTADLYQLLQRYFAVAERCARPLVRVRWVGGAPLITLRWPPVALIALGNPMVEQHADGQVISVSIRGGLLAAPGTHGVLSIAVTRGPAATRASVELVGYRPRGDGVVALRWLCRWLQAPLHVHVGRRFLRELQRRSGPEQARSGPESQVGAPSGEGLCTSTCP